MATRIALLRGINVSGQKLIKMAELREALTDSGLNDVQTYIQSGNIVFNDDGLGEITAAERIHTTIMQHFGHDVEVIMRDSDQIADAIDRISFEDTPANKIYISFLQMPPSHSSDSDFDTYLSEGEMVRISGREVFLNCPNGRGKSKLSNNLIESKLGVIATTRNLRTTRKLLDMAR